MHWRLLMCDCMGAPEICQKLRHAQPHSDPRPTPGNAFHLRGYRATRGVAQRCEPPAHRW
jgi:hypothetical protein